MVEPARAREFADGELVPGTPYRVVGLLGAGGMGCVYEVEHVELGRRYVLKSMLKELSSRRDLIARMRNEWRALGRLRHRNIVDVINAGMSSAGTPFFVMELLVGETVSEKLSRHRRLAWPEAARIAHDVLLGLHEAHRIGIVHRDIKPANVFICSDRTVKILDFGIAKVRYERVTETGQRTIGTPRYMSPEQATGSLADARSDVYAVGLLLFEMVTGEGPFEAITDPTQLMLAQVSCPPPRASSLVEIPGDLDETVARALAKEPEARPQSAAEMAELLAPFLDSLDSHARPERTVWRSSVEAALPFESSSVPPVAGPWSSRPEHRPSLPRTQTDAQRDPAVQSLLASIVRAVEAGQPVANPALPDSGDDPDAGGQGDTPPTVKHVRPSSPRSGRRLWAVGGVAAGLGLAGAAIFLVHPSPPGASAPTPAAEPARSSAGEAVGARGVDPTGASPGEPVPAPAVAAAPASASATASASAAEALPRPEGSRSRPEDGRSVDRIEAGVSPPGPSPSSAVPSVATARPPGPSLFSPHPAGPRSLRPAPSSGEDWLPGSGL